MNKQQLANKIWESANKMRSKIEANEYKDYILGFIFYKYLSDTEIKFLKEKEYTNELLPTVVEDDDETVKWVQRNIGYFISYGNLFSTWIAMGKDFDVSNVRDALSAFGRLISPSALGGFVPDWIGEFYAYYQWQYNIPSRVLIKKVPLDYLKNAYAGLHDLELELAVKKVGIV